MSERLMWNRQLYPFVTQPVFFFFSPFFMCVQKDHWVITTGQFLFSLIMYLVQILFPPSILPSLSSSSSLWGPLLGAFWCHPLPGLARLLQRLPELWVGRWGRAGKLHKDQLWQVCMTVIHEKMHVKRCIHNTVGSIHLCSSVHVHRHRRYTKS